MPTNRGCLAFFTGAGRKHSAAGAALNGGGRGGGAPSSSTFPAPQPSRKPLGPPAPPVPASPPTAAQTHAAEQLLATADTRPARVCAALLANAAAHPGDARFRRIRLANPRIHACVVCVPGALELLEASGFRVVFESASKRDPEARAEGFAVLSPETRVLGASARGALVAGVDLLRPALPPALAATPTFSVLSMETTRGGGGGQDGGDGDDEALSSPPPLPRSGGGAATPPPPALAQRVLSRLRSTSSAAGTPRVEMSTCGADAAADAACVAGMGDDDDDDDGGGAGAGGGGAIVAAAAAAVPSSPTTPSPAALTPTVSRRVAAACAAAGTTRLTTVLLPSAAAPQQPPAWVAALLPAATKESARLAAAAAANREKLSTPGERAQRAASMARIASRRASAASRASSVVGGSSAGGGSTARPGTPSPLTRVTVRLPEALSLASDFAASDKGAAVEAWVRSCLADQKDGGPAPDFDLVGDGGAALARKAAVGPGVAGALALALRWKGAPPARALLKEVLMAEARVAMA